MSHYLKLIDKFNFLLKLLLGIMSAIMVIVLCAQVISRTFLNSSIYWSEELSRYLMIYMVFIGAAIALRNQQLMAIEFITEKVSEHTAKVLKTIANLIGIIFFIIMFFQGIQVMSRVSTQLSAALQIPMSFVYLALPLGAILLALNAIAVIIEINTKKRTVKKESNQRGVD